MSAAADRPFVVACTPIRNRAWIVHDHLEALLDQPLRGVLRGMYYLTGDNEDSTLNALDHLQEDAGFRFDSFVVEEFNTNSPHWSRDRPGERYTGDDHASLSRVYNHLIDRALALFPKATHLWLVDSDVLPEPGCLEQLLAADKDVIAPVVEHSPGVYNFMVGTGDDGEPRRRGEGAALGYAQHPKMNRPNPLIRATFVSCCVLYRRAVLEAEESLSMTIGDEVVSEDRRPMFRFAPHPRSHDFPMMASLRRAGVELWVHPGARAEHRMEEPSR